ncbi:MAG: hypothetical protein J6P49_01645 [Paludibacteraceae bacterium]|nr:hypothetical protein [Paludibacteraceae bacterium]
MKSKIDRRENIVDIISNEMVGNQDDLLKALKDRGFDLTQATLSRDLKSLRIVKHLNQDGKYEYKMPEEPQKKRSVLAVGEVTIEFSGNIAVLKTKAGYASGLALDIDEAGISCIIGTIAGDDTIFLVKKENAKREEMISVLGKIIERLKIIE